jgi:hypothetical protein
MTSRRPPLPASLAVAGPAAIGAVVGLPAGPFAAAHHAVAVPLVVLGVTAVAGAIAVGLRVLHRDAFDEQEPRRLQLAIYAGWCALALLLGALLYARTIAAGGWR